MAKWRSKDWENIKRENCCFGDCETCPAEPMTCDISGEKLVDAMLEALKKERSLFDHKLKSYSWDKDGENGWLVHIPVPEEENEIR